jgi:hypothetical protein
MLLMMEVENIGWNSGSIELDRIEIGIEIEIERRIKANVLVLPFSRSAALIGKNRRTINRRTINREAAGSRVKKKKNKGKKNALFLGSAV